MSDRTTWPTEEEISEYLLRVARDYSFNALVVRDMAHAILALFPPPEDDEAVAERIVAAVHRQGYSYIPSDHLRALVLRALRGEGRR